MTYVVLTIPIMLVAVLIAVGPLVWAMRHHEEWEARNAPGPDHVNTANMVREIHFDGEVERGDHGGSSSRVPSHETLVDVAA